MFYDQNSSPKFTTNSELGKCICEKFSPNFMTKTLLENLVAKILVEILFAKTFVENLFAKTLV
jgi:hypothetical protein